jgi:TPR repeat protein
MRPTAIALILGSCSFWSTPSVATDTTPLQTADESVGEAAEGVVSDQPPEGFIVECVPSSLQRSDLSPDATFGETRLAAERGDAEAQYRLALYYRTGTEVCPDNKKAVDWLHRAANQGHAGAQYALGAEASNPVQAYHWYLRAAEQGHSQAEYVVGRALEEGNGVPRNYRKAVEWYRKSAESGHADGMFRLGLLYEQGRGTERDYSRRMRGSA